MNVEYSYKSIQCTKTQTDLFGRQQNVVCYFIYMITNVGYNDTDCYQFDELSISYKVHSSTIVVYIVFGILKLWFQ